MLSQVTNQNQLSIISISDLNTEVNHEPRILDTRLAEALGFSQPRDIRKIITRHSGALEKFGNLTEEEYTYRGKPAKRYYLNERQALYICTKSDAENATDVTINMVEVYYKFRHGDIATEPATITRAQAGEITQLILERAGEDKAAIPYFRARFNNHFRLASYKELPANKFGEAVAYIPTMPDKLPKQLALPSPVAKMKYREEDIAQGAKIASGLYDLVDSDVFAMSGHSKDMLKNALGKLRGCLTAVRSNDCTWPVSR